MDLPTRPRLAAIGLAIALLGWPALPRAAGGEPATVREIARIGPDVITTLRLETWMRGVKVPPGYPDEPDPVITDALVQNLLLELELRAAKRAGVEVSARSVEEAVAARLEAMGAGDEARVQLARSGQLQILRDQLRRNFTLRRFYRRHASAGEGTDRLDAIIRPGEVARYYDEHREEFRAPAAAHVRLLLRRGPSAEREATLATARDLVRRARDGEDFQQLARHESQGPRRESGGDFGWVERGGLSPAIEAWAFDAEPGAVSDPIEASPGQFWVVQLVDRRPPGVRPYGEVQGEIADRLRAQRVARLRRRLVAELIARAEIRPKWVETALYDAAKELGPPGS